MKKSKNTAVKSAQTLAVLRAVSAEERNKHIRCGDYLAKIFLSLSYKLMTSIRPKSLLKEIINKISPGSYFFTIIRTKHFDNILIAELDKGIEQVVILGAGYDTRALRFNDKLKRVSVFEIDFPATQEYKLKQLRKSVPCLPQNITFIPLDFNQRSFEDALISFGFSAKKKTLYLWEGVSYYLPENVVKKILDVVGNNAEGSSIVFDYATKSFVNGNHTSYGGKQIAAWLKKVEEPFLFGLDANETNQFLSKSNLSVCSDYGPSELEKMYLKSKNGKLAGRTLGHVRMVHAMVL